MALWIRLWKIDSIDLLIGFLWLIDWLQCLLASLGTDKSNFPYWGKNNSDPESRALSGKQNKTEKNDSERYFDVIFTVNWFTALAHYGIDSTFWGLWTRMSFTLQSQLNGTKYRLWTSFQMPSQNTWWPSSRSQSTMWRSTARVACEPFFFLLPLNVLRWQDTSLCLLSSAATGKVNLEKPLHLVIGSVSPNAVLLSWGNSLKTPYDGNILDECLEDGWVSPDGPTNCQ